MTYNVPSYVKKVEAMNPDADVIALYDAALTKQENLAVFEKNHIRTRHSKGLPSVSELGDMRQARPAEYLEGLTELKNRMELVQETAKELGPRMYAILIRHNWTPEHAAATIYKDLQGLWNKDTIRRLLPRECKDAQKSKAARIGNAQRESKVCGTNPAEKNQTELPEHGIPNPSDSLVRPVESNLDMLRRIGQIEEEDYRRLAAAPHIERVQESETKKYFEVSKPSPRLPEPLMTLEEVLHTVGKRWADHERWVREARITGKLSKSEQMWHEGYATGLKHLEDDLIAGINRKAMIGAVA